MYQKLIIIGNLGRDPEMQYTQDGLEVTKCSVACKDGKDKTIWIRITTFGKTAQAVKQHLSKGKRALFEGQLQADDNGNPEIWTDREGKAHSSFQMIANQVVFLSPKDDGERAVDDMDNIPF